MMNQAYKKQMNRESLSSQQFRLSNREHFHLTGLLYAVYFSRLRAEPEDEQEEAWPSRGLPSGGRVRHRY